MKLSKLNDIIQRHISLLGSRSIEERDLDVSVLLSKPSVGGRSMCGVKDVGFGFDWEQGKFIIYPEKPLVPKSDKEEAFDQAFELLLYIATKPVKKETYEIGQARRMFERMGFDYMQHQKIMHRDKF